VGRKSCFDDILGDDGDGDYDDASDTPEVTMVTLTREVKEPIPVKIEATISESHMTKIVCFRTDRGGRAAEEVHCYVDSVDPEPILNALEIYIEQGRWSSIFAFFKEQGMVVLDPHVFRMKMDAVMGETCHASDRDDMF